MLVTFLPLPWPDAASLVLALKAALRFWADHAVLPSVASWQAVTSDMH